MLCSQFQSHNVNFGKFYINPISTKVENKNKNLLLEKLKIICLKFQRFSNNIKEFGY